MPALGLAGGAALQRKLADFQKKMAGQPVLRVGFLEKAKYDNGTQVAMVAAIQEFGAPRLGIPPRPFFRTMVAAKKAEWGPAIGRIMKINDDDVVKSLKQLGQDIEGDLRLSIVQTNAPPLSPVTIMLRKMKRNNPSLRDTMTYADVTEARRRVAAGYSVAGTSVKPLVDTGHMLASISSEVVTP